MKKLPKIVLAICALGVVLATASCGGTTNAAGTVSHLYIADGNNRIVDVQDMFGAGWATYGTTGSGTGQFNDPTGLATDAQGRIYIADYFNNRIVRIDNISGANWVEFGSAGTGTGQFSNPYKIALDSQGRIYVTDSGNNRVVRISNMNGSGWTTYGAVGSGTGQFSTPIGIAIDSNDKIYLTDWGNSRVVRIDDMTGANWTALGSNGSGIGQFQSPVDIAVDNAGSMIIADRSRGLIQTNVMSTTNWTEFSFPYAQSVISLHGQIYMVDQNNDQVTRIDNIAGDNLLQYGSTGSGIDQFSSPVAIAGR